MTTTIIGTENFFPQSDDVGPDGKDAVPEKPKGFVEDTGFVEECTKCRGTGRYRNFGPCFACKGKGSNTFKTSKAARAKGRVSAANRKVRTERENIEAFKSEHPAQMAWIMSNPSFEFAVSLLKAIAEYGRLTDGQLAAVDRCLARAAEKNTARKANSVTVDVSPIIEVFASATAAGLKRPKLRLTGDLVFSLAPATGRNAGAIYIKRGDDYLGKIVGGEFSASYSCTTDDRKAIEAACVAPLDEAVAYGKHTGSCACCGRELTNPESIDRGIGPVCAEKYGW